MRVNQLTSAPKKTEKLSRSNSNSTLRTAVLIVIEVVVSTKPQCCRKTSSPFTCCMCPYVSIDTRVHQGCDLLLELRAGIVLHRFHDKLSHQADSAAEIGGSKDVG